MAKETEFDPFEVDDSNEIGDYTAKVLSSTFDTDPEYNDGETLLLQWDMEITGGDVNFETRKMSFTCGSKFESPDGGKTAAHESIKNKGFNSQSRMGMLCKRAFFTGQGKTPTIGGATDGEEIEAFGLRDHFAAMGTHPLEARGWVGIEFAIHSESRDWGGEIGVRSFEMPIEVIALPTEGEDKPKAKKKAVAKKKVAKKATVDWDQVKEAVLNAGAEAEDFETFIVVGTAYVTDAEIPEETEGFSDFFDWLGDEDEGGWAQYIEDE